MGGMLLPCAVVGLSSTKVRLSSMEVGLTSTEVGLSSTEVKLGPTEVGLSSMEVGLTSAEVGLSSTEMNLGPMEVELSSEGVRLGPAEAHLTTLLNGLPFKALGRIREILYQELGKRHYKDRVRAPSPPARRPRGGGQAPALRWKTDVLPAGSPVRVP